MGREKAPALAGYMTTKHPEFVLRRVGFSLSDGNFASLNLKPLQVKCFETILKGQDVIGVLPTGSGKSILFHGGTVLATIKNN